MENGGVNRAGPSLQDILPTKRPDTRIMHEANPSYVEMHLKSSTRVFASRGPAIIVSKARKIQGKSETPV